MLRNIFGKKDDDEEIRIPTLATMRVGDLVDYDLKTWQVTGYSNYDYAGDRTDEWELSAGDEVRFLERGVENGQVWWTWMQSLSLNQLDCNLGTHMQQHDDPPESLKCDGITFEAVQSSTGLAYEGGSEQGRQFIAWTYESQDGRILAISQWDEAEFSAFWGHYVEEYQFTDILPGSQNDD